VRITWVVYGSLAQQTGGYVYDRLIVEALRSAGEVVDVISLLPGARGRALRESTELQAADALVLDALCVPDLADLLDAIERPPTVLLVHHLTSWETELDGVQLQDAERRVLERCHAVVTTSQATAARLYDAMGIRCAVVTPGADRLPVVASQAPRSPILRLLLVGSLIPRKRVLTVLAALDRCQTDAFEARLVGDEGRCLEYTARVEATIAASARLRARVIRLGVVDDRRLADELARADFLILASSLEGYGMVLTEARRAGLPQLVARSASLSEVVLNGDDVVLFDDEHELSGLLDQLAEDEPWRARLRSAAEARAASTPTWADASAAFRTALQRVVSGRAIR
jgi:glycosyltransferase involved in cell wall biosynthesis